MPVPFKDLRDAGTSGLAGFLRFVAGGRGGEIRGALFVMEANGDPVEFAFARTEVSTSILWRSGDARRRAIAGLAAALFEACTKSPAIVFARSEEVPSRVLSEDLRVDVPMGLVASGPDGPTILWATPSSLPSDASRLLEELEARHLVEEPFARAGAGIEEAFRA